MIRRILQWLGLAERPAISREANRAIAAILTLDAYRQEHGHDFTTGRLQFAKSPWRASILDFIS
jgi:hypothetical protein